MEDYSRKRKLSEFHLAQRKKQAKKECPGCRQLFVAWYFEKHKRVNFQDNRWTCSNQSYNFCSNNSNKKECNEERPEILVNTLDHVDNVVDSLDHVDNNATISKHQVSSVFSQFMRKKLKTHSFASTDFSKESQECDSEFEDEIWNDVSLDELDLDLQDTRESFEESSLFQNQNMSMGAILVWLCMFICVWQTANMIPDHVINSLLSFLSSFFDVLSKDVAVVSSIVPVFPGSVYLMWKNLGFKKDNFHKFVICRRCYTIYKYEDCILKLEGQSISATCSHIEFPNHPQRARRKVCGEILLKCVTLSNGSKKLYPFKTYCYKPICDSLKSLVVRPSFEQMCERWRERKKQEGFMTDIYDGKVWKEFQEEGKNCFLSQKQHYAIMLNLDWFQPFEHVKYSVGVLYAVILNLPREERFKLKNVMIIGIIPDLNGEPSVNSFISPLIDELKEAWAIGFKMTSYNSPHKKLVFKMALLCVGCDIPATRKLCGFLGHSANFGCSKCFKVFPGQVGQKDYSGFDTNNWKKRTLTHHKQCLNDLSKAKTQTEREQLESKCGMRYSKICELDYFDPIRMSIVDPMHNLFQGTAKRMIKIWLELKVLKADHLQLIQSKVDSVDAASNIGAIPRKIASSFGGFTAEQWKNWTVIFSVFALKDILPKRDLDLWRHFVLACRVLVCKYISFADLQIFQNHILEFCKGIERVYGKSKVTPNMHMHCHLQSCVYDYGPVYSFWLFSFERYNGHLGSMPSNSRSIEMQLMRRFTRDAFVNSLSFPSLHQDHFFKHIAAMENSHHALPDIQSCSDADILRVLYMSKKSAPVCGQEWHNISAFSCPKFTCKSLSCDDYKFLQKTYLHLYPNYKNSVETMPLSYRRCPIVYLGTDVYGSWQSRHKRSSYIMAYWHINDGKILSNVGTGNLVPGVIQYFLIHNLIVENESKVHLFAKVLWLKPLPTLYRFYCGKPTEAWSRDLYDVFGESGFIPVQRIFCKFVKAEGTICKKKISFVCPIVTGINV